MGASIGGALLCGAVSADGGEPPPDEPILEDDFSGDGLDGSLWVRTAHNDFQEEVVEVVGGLLHVGCSTIGTEDATVKRHGVRTREPVAPVAGGVRIEYTVDWNDPFNGCYMQAGAYVSPQAGDNPEGLDDRLEFVYVGVPPGQTARGWVTLRQDGRHPTILMDENWPDDRDGREIDVQRIAMELTPESLRIVENGERILAATDLELDWDQAYLYLQQMSHSNYPMRSVFFDDVRIERL
jgi:hypothetical protein